MNSIYKMLFFAVILISLCGKLHSEGFIINHECLAVDNIPENYIVKAKNEIYISYGHTSHGSQLISGMTVLRSLPNSVFDFNRGQGSLVILDGTPSGDLGNPDRTTWEKRTRELLAQNKQINTVMWSWCGQVDGSEEDINTYLTLMDGLERDFPDVNFIYMTGHLNGSGEEGNVNLRNDQIRYFCKMNGKILFDFADIESYDPDGKYFLDKYADDGCNYKDNGTKKNWASEWCLRNPGSKLCMDCSCAHSMPLNCNMKGRAFWWMMARIAGWNGVLNDVEDTPESDGPYTYPNPASDIVKINPGKHAAQGYLYIYGQGGKLLKRVRINSENNNNKYIAINTGDLNSGMYFYRIITVNSTESGKFVIMK